MLLLQNVSIDFKVPVNFLLWGCRALKMDGEQVMGRALKVMYAQPSKGTQMQRRKHFSQPKARRQQAERSHPAVDDHDPLEA
jgi:hypothetical protein